MTAFPEPADLEHVFGEPVRGTTAAAPESPAASRPWRVVDTDGSVRTSVPETPGSVRETSDQTCAGCAAGPRPPVVPGTDRASAEQRTNIEALAQQLAQATGPIDMPSPDPKLDVGAPVRFVTRSPVRATAHPVSDAPAPSSRRAAATTRPGAARVVETQLSGVSRRANLDSLLSQSPAALSPPRSRRATAARKSPFSPGPSISASRSGRQETDPALARVVERWSALPRGVRAAVMAMVEAGANG